MKQTDLAEIIGGPTIVCARPSWQSNVRIEATDAGYLIFSPYSAAFVQALKEIVPYGSRSWNGESKAWAVETAYGQTVQGLIQKHFNKNVELPEIKLVTKEVTEMLRVEYLGACKERNGQNVASGFVNGGWNAVFPESVLRAWFENHVPAGTLYAELGIAQDGDAQAVKSAYRRMARQWHPDYCKETNAQERFLVIQRAYELLSDPQKRKRYDVGLAFSNSARFAPARASQYGYRTPLRCGLVTVEASKTIKGYSVTKIVNWEDVIRADGLVMSSSWDLREQTFVIDWVVF